MSKIFQKKRGGILIQVIAFMAIGMMFLSGFIGWGIMSVRVARHMVQREQAIDIAEAGIAYYRWHIAHAPTDFQDGTGVSGPYVHPFYDKSGVQLGTYSLDITPPLLGSTLVTVTSTGTVLADPSIHRTLQAKFAKPSLAKYAIVSNSDVRFGSGTEIWGPVHSNGGINFNGLIHNIMTSAKTTYIDPDYGTNEWSVHTLLSPADPNPPTTLPSRPDVFMVGRQVGVPAVDFSGMTADLAQIKVDAQAGGKYYAASGALGYHIVLKTNETFDIYRVNTLIAPPNGNCKNWVPEDRWGIWSINTQTLVGNYAIPANGLIFVEDNLWIDGQINTARLTVASGRFPENPSTYTNIIVNNNLLYTNYDGQDVIALMSQGDIGAGLRAASTERIDAALIAQNGRVGMNFYYTSCGTTYSQKTIITLYGMMASNKRYGFQWGCGGSCWSGYWDRNIIYDPNLIYSPPPSFPLTTSQYQILSWDEI